MLLRHVQSVRRYAAFRPPAVAELATLRKNEVKAVAEQARGLVEIYREALEHSPVRANALTSGVLCAFGDVLAQTVERRMSSDSNASQGRFDRWRTARMAVYGTFICGPLLSGWYVTLHHLGEAISVTYRPIVGGWLGRLTPFGHLHKEASGTLSPLQLLLAKVTADGLLFQAPFLNLYFATMGALEGLSPSAIFDKCIEKFHRAWALSIVVWTPVQLINLWYVPHSLQPVFVAAVNVGWKTVLAAAGSNPYSPQRAQTHPLA
uniref:Peroxisomal membrane protein MPV17 n=1 Tax=Haptolina ericina TaxID=156174 RepID=A0A7S3EQN8_9EUKA|mmetsp:Transcript_13882/g.31416  ORF Transcript_13882/g.31416 Transcript_13882/m.31416 type:complete len:263 (+) Transcript_13882:27-815(+)